MLVSSPDPNVFQVITSRGSRFIDSWTNHIRGAVALLELRGVEQLQDPDGLQLFLQLRYQIVRPKCLLRPQLERLTNLQCVKDHRLSPKGGACARLSSSLCQSCHVSTAAYSGLW